MQFQALPEGTGSLMNEVAENEFKDIELKPWVGDLPQAEDLLWLPVHRLSVLLRERHISPVELTRKYLDRLSQIDESLICVVNFLEESAFDDARQAEEEISQGRWRGPLHGIPWGVKDIFTTREAPTTLGVEQFQSRVIDEDANVVQRLREAGAILIAKLSTGALAIGDEWYRGQTRNPWNTSEGSSGSSAGPAAATAAAGVAFGIGAETLGSITSPASVCGVSALRPTFGRVGRSGCMTLCSSLDKVGPMARSIEDCAIVFNSIHGIDPLDPSTLSTRFEWGRDLNLSGIKIGYADGTPPEFLELLGNLGAEPVRTSPGFLPEVESVVGIVNAVESAASLAWLPNEVVPDSLRNVLEQSASVTAVTYLNAISKRYELMLEMKKFFRDVDLYASLHGDVLLTNLTGHPAVVLPIGFEGGRPKMIKLIGDLFADDKLLSVAHAYQAATEWHLRRPEIEWPESPMP